MHGIVKPIDKLFSLEGTGWHDLADQVDAITEVEMKQISPEIIESPLFVVVNGKQIALPNHKTLVADYSECDREDMDEKYVPLHIPKNTYTPISNGAVYAAAQEFCKDLGLKIVTAGTLEAGKKFFISVDIGSANFKAARGEEFSAFLCFITSHDGTLAMQAYDSLIRIICMNTLRWSLEAAGKVGFRVYHKKNSQLEMTNLPQLLKNIVDERARFAEFTQELEEIECQTITAKQITAGYFAENTDNMLSTRSFNAVEEIVNLHSRGIGNRGKSMYDLFNGFTEYYTHGNGTGKKGTRETKAYKAAMGAAADHKNAFVDILVDPDRRNEVQHKGERALALMN